MIKKVNKLKHVSIGILLTLSCIGLVSCMPGTRVPTHGSYGRRVWIAGNYDDFGNWHPGHWRFYMEPWGYQYYYGQWFTDQKYWNKPQPPWHDGYPEHAYRPDNTPADRELIPPYDTHS